MNLSHLNVQLFLYKFNVFRLHAALFLGGDGWPRAPKFYILATCVIDLRTYVPDYNTDNSSCVYWHSLINM